MTVEDKKFSILTKLNLFSYFDEVPFICSSSETHITHMLTDLILSHRSLKLCSLFFNLFTLYSSDWNFPTDLSSRSQVSPSITRLLLSPCWEFLIFVIASFNTKTVLSTVFFFSKSIVTTYWFNVIFPYDFLNIAFFFEHICNGFASWNHLLFNLVSRPTQTISIDCFFFFSSEYNKTSFCFFAYPRFFVDNWTL